jgi:glycosyltransferase involved in cell wall biosynthesis
MPVFNEDPGMLEEAISSVLRQTFADFEFIIVDDGSDRRESTSALDAFAARDTRIRVFHEPRRGVYKARNFGLTQCRGEFVFKHDSDDWSEPERFRRQIDFLRAHPEIGIVGSYTLTHQQNGRPLWVWRYPTSPGKIAETLPFRMTFSSGAVCFRSQAMRAIGGFRETFPYSQDYDCYWRLSDRFGGANLPEVLYHYRFTLKGISTSKSREQERCAVITRELGLMRRRDGTEDVDLAVRRADEWMAQNAVETDVLRQADYTMLSGARGAALKLYIKSAGIKPLSAKAWLKLLRWVVFVAVPPLRRTIFQAEFRTPQTAATSPNMSQTRRV